MSREMKDSRIEWIGEIPKEWKIVKMNNVCTAITDYVASGSFANLAENVQYLDEPDYAMLIRTMDISKKGYSGKPVYINKHAYEFLSNSNLFGGEIILPNIGASVGDVYIVPKLYERMSLAPNSIMIRTAECNKYIYYFFYCDAGKMSVIDIAQSTAQPKFNKTDFRQLRITLPPLLEQQKIADYLDSECAKIDDVITKTKATIEEYKKLKQSVITEAVTKGIRPNREMKDSGIEWIGEIPREWEISRAKYIASSMYKGNGITKEDVVENGDTPCVRYGEIYTKYNYSFGSCKTRTDRAKINSPQYFSYGDILFVCTGELVEEIGKNIVYLGKEKCFAGGDIIVMHHNQEPRYLNYALGCSAAQTQKSCGKSKLKVVHISASEIGNIITFLPNFGEQQEIADYLDQKCSEIDTLIAKKEQIVTELESYKKSLIYEYVTGKKEVV